MAALCSVMFNFTETDDTAGRNNEKKIQQSSLKCTLFSFYIYILQQRCTDFVRSPFTLPVMFFVTNADVFH